MILLLLFGVTLLINSCFCIDPDAGKTPLELIETHGYPAETHTVVTDDDYILTVYRIPHGKNSISKEETRSPVLIVHGLLSSSADFLDMANKSLGFILADNGYDVWLLNCRGTTFSRAHKTLDPDKDAAKFFNFTWHEIGATDIPNTIDHILSVTKQEKLFYIGHSQGTTSYAVMGSVRPEYNDKIRFAALLAPSVFFNHTDLSLKLISHFWKNLTVLEGDIKLYEVPGNYGNLFRKFAQYVCDVGSPLQGVCITILELIGYNDESEVDKTKIAVALSNFPNNAAIRQLMHYAQIIAEERFQWFDDGESENSVNQPQEYDVSLINSPVGLFYAKNDFFAHLKDVAALREKLPNVVVNYEVPFEKFNHIDFVFAKDVVKLLYNDLLKFMKQY